MKFRGLSLVVGSWFIAGAVSAAGPAIPCEPPCGTAAALPSGPVPAPEPSPTARPSDEGVEESWRNRRALDKLLNVDVELASAYVWRGINMFGTKQNTQTASVFPSLTATFGQFISGYSSQSRSS